MKNTGIAPDFAAGIEYVEAELRNIHQNADSRALTPDEESRWDEGITYLEQARAQIERAERVAGFADLARDARKVVSGDGARQTGPEFLRQVETRDVELRGLGVREVTDIALKRTEQYDGMTPDNQARVERFVRSSRRDPQDPGLIARHVAATSSESYRDAFSKIFRDPEAGLMTLNDEERHALGETRAMSLTQNTGGYAVPLGLDSTFIQIGDGAASSIRQVATVRTTTAVDIWRGVTAAQATASYDAEGSEVSDDTQTFAQPTITLYTGRAFIPVTLEGLMDIPDLEAEVGLAIADAKDRLEASQFVTGSGSAPQGVLTAVAATAGSRVSPATGGAFALADVYTVHQALPPRFRGKGPNALSWMSNVKYINAIRQFATANNYHGFTVDLTAANVPAVLGSPWYEASAMTSTTTTSNDIVIFGDFSRFYIIDRLGLSVSYIPHMFSTGSGLPTGKSGWFANWRHGSDSIDDNAMRVLRL